jgi:hypothetical protein
VPSAFCSPKRSVAVTDVTARGDSLSNINPAETTKRKHSIMNLPSLKSLAVALATGVFGIGSSASASTVLLDVDGPVGGLISIAGDGSRAYVATAATFSVNQTISNATLGMSVFCRDCAGTVSLFSIPPTPNPPARALEARETFVGPSGRTPDFDLNGIISMPELLAGVTYTMVLQMTSGSGAWLSSPLPTFKNGAVTPGTNFVTRDARITNIIGYPFEDISTLNVPGAPLLYQISGTVAPVGPPVAPVPVPASLPILLMGIGALWLLRRRQPGLA